jgi:uncharacterized membrane protein YtjA (UPF0391 family)
MKKNIGSIDKVVRVIIALVATYFAYKGGFESAWVSYVLYAVAIIMLLTTLISSCPIYSIFGMQTNSEKEE